ncbi:sugar transferase [Flavobacterium ardleyense]|uniref:Sugar transferase n=1 Tax=Flavobacterium ardleyense TaxID=2038737 RepID=A0ABW5Z399_9FLAO
MPKRLFDLIFALISVIILAGLLLLSLLLASIDTYSFGLFWQDRIGQHGKRFKIFKIKSLHDSTKKVTAFGRCLRAFKLDELPQLLNIILGQMSFVGPRPDLPGFADLLQGNDRQFLTLKPGLTGLASLKYRNEETLLAKQASPQNYNDTVIWPDKVRINNWYSTHRSFIMDIQILFYTVFPFLSFDVEEFMNERR